MPFRSPSESLEIVPGLIVSQHSGEGKANQYFLRGFNLDHGTDLALYLDGMPLNMRTHGHGQGYADANFLIPELCRLCAGAQRALRAPRTETSPRPARSTSAVHRQNRQRLFTQVTGGSFGYAPRFRRSSPIRISLAATPMAPSKCNIYNGPWERGDEAAPDQQRPALDARHAERRHRRHRDGLRQPLVFDRSDSERAVYYGLMSLWGTLDPTDGGDTTRFSLSGRWSQTEGNHCSRVEALRHPLDSRALQQLHVLPRAS